MKLDIRTDFTKFPRAVSVLAAGEAGTTTPYDSAVLAHDERHLRRRAIETARSDKVLVDLPEPVTLNHGDRLVLEDGRHIEIIAAEEPLYDVRASDPVHLAELAWHIGNRHLAAAIEAGRILILRDHVIKAMLEGLGAAVSDVSEPFRPMRGAYSGHGGHGHAHAEAHTHSHAESHSHSLANRIPTAIRTTMTMTDQPSNVAQPSNIALLRLMAWLSPSFPVGGFSYSHGLEQAVHAGLVADSKELAAWLETLVEMGSGWNDAVLFAESWRRARETGDLDEIVALAEALAGSRERHTETMLQGAAFLKAASAWPCQVLDRLPAECAYCVAVGAVAGDHGISLRDALAAFLQAFFSNLVQAAIRLGVLGQSAAMALLAAFEPLALATADRAARSTLDDLGGCAFVSDIVAMKHETQYSRLFRS